MFQSFFDDVPPKFVSLVQEYQNCVALMWEVAKGADQPVNVVLDSALMMALRKLDPSGFSGEDIKEFTVNMLELNRRITVAVEKAAENADEFDTDSPKPATKTSRDIN